jgi:ABC-2 type transport system ATP-binding protein/lipopolysaccharide transport system ATP-binding protein
LTTAIELDGVGKRYLLGEDAEDRSLRAALSAFARRRTRRREELWSLRDVSLAIHDCESVGVIGRNGAGKTTMLKLVARITEPTEGVVRTRGRVGSLLEVGTGFHPQLTGRENVYLNGAILGLRSREINRRFDEIVDFAGVERFLDTPIKRYSSGMQLRLAFAVAAHVDSDIMLVDEVLAVGDAEFQRKCMTKVRSLGTEGRTVVFVSHDLDTVSSLCSRTVWLDRGQVMAAGPSKEIVDSYLSSGVAHRGRRSFEHVAGSSATICGLAVLGDDGAPSDTLRRERPFMLEVDYTLHEPVPGFDLALSVCSTAGTRILEEAFTSQLERPDRGAPGRYRAALTVPPILRAGDYTVTLWAGSAYETLVWEEHALTFRLLGNPGDHSNRLLDLGLPFRVERLD